MDEGPKSDMEAAKPAETSDSLSLRGKCTCIFGIVGSVANARVDTFAGNILPVVEESGINQILQSVGAVSYYAADIKAHVLAEAGQTLSDDADGGEVCSADSQENALHVKSSPESTAPNCETKLITPVFSEVVLPLKSDASSADSSDDFEFLGTSTTYNTTASSSTATVYVPWTCSACTYVHFPPVESTFLACAVCGTVRDNKTSPSLGPNVSSTLCEELANLDQEYASSDVYSTEYIHTVVDDNDNDEDYEEDNVTNATTTARSTVKARKINNNKLAGQTQATKAQSTSVNSIAKSSQPEPITRESDIKLQRCKEREINLVAEETSSKSLCQSQNLTRGAKQPPPLCLASSRKPTAPTSRRGTSISAKGYMV